MQNYAIPSQLLGSYPYQDIKTCLEAHIMNTLHSPTNESSPLSGPAHRPFNPMAQLWQAIAARWAAHLAAARQAHEFDFAADMSAGTLRDIGAPEAMISRAVQRQEMRYQRVHEPLRQWRNG